MTCPRCGDEAPPGARFCAKCGEALSIPTNVPPPAAAEPLPRTATTTPPPAPKPARGCLRTVGCGCLGLIVLLVVVGGGGYLGFRSGVITPNTFLNLVGLGPA